MSKLMTNDAMQANMAWVVSQTTAIETGVYRARYPEIRYPGLIPVDYSAPEWIKSVTYYSMDGAGKAEWLADRARDIPVVGLSMDKSETTVALAGIGYDYGLEEVNQAQFLGMNLPGEKANLARLVYERMVDRVALSGDTEKGYQGLLNYSGVTVASAPTGDWATATEDEILGDINALLQGIYTTTNELAMADTLLLPSTKMQFLGSKKLTDAGGMTLLQWIRETNIFTQETGRPLTIRSLRGLATAGAGGINRMIAYRNAAEVLKMHIPMRHRFLPLQVQGLTYQIPGIFRLGGLDIRLPKEVRYMDGI